MTELKADQPRARITGGIFAPIITPFSEDGRRVDLEAFSAVLGHLAASGIDGILLLGTNGEFGFLSQEEKWALIEAVGRAETGLKLIVGATVPESIEETLRFAQRLDETLPPSAALLIAPPFFDRYTRGGSATADETVSFYRRLLDLRLSHPLLAYNLPVPAAGPATAAASPQVVELLAQSGSLGNFAGVKDSTGIVDHIPRYLSAMPAATIMIGNDHAIAGAIEHGAAGSITACANLFPSAVQAVWSAASGADRHQAQLELSRLRNVLESIPGKMIGAEKLLLLKLGVLNHRSPLRDATAQLSADEELQLLAAMAAALESLELNRDLRGALTEAT